LPVVVCAEPPADAPSIALAKVDGKKVGGGRAPVNRAELLPGTHDFMVQARYPSASGTGAHRPPLKAVNADGPAKFAVKNVSLQPGACYVVASDLLGDAWLEPVVRDARPTDPGFKLCGYTARSAEPVGRLLLALFGYRDPELVRYADEMSTALQLTNFWQDVKNDWARGRIYLPREEMQAHGADETALVGDSLTPEWREAIASAVSRTRALFDDGRPLCDRLRGRLRYEIRMTWLGGTRILDRIEAAKFDVLNHRPTIGATDIPWLVGVTLGWPRSIPSRAATT
jgi:hypothetical protein